MESFGDLWWLHWLNCGFHVKHLHVILNTTSKSNPEGSHFEFVETLCKTVPCGGVRDWAGIGVGRSFVLITKQQIIRRGPLLSCYAPLLIDCC